MKSKRGYTARQRKPHPKTDAILIAWDEAARACSKCALVVPSMTLIAKHVGCSIAQVSVVVRAKRGE